MSGPARMHRAKRAWSLREAQSRASPADQPSCWLTLVESVSWLDPGEHDLILVGGPLGVYLDNNNLLEDLEQRETRGSFHLSGALRAGRQGWRTEPT